MKGSNGKSSLSVLELMLRGQFVPSSDEEDNSCNYVDSTQSPQPSTSKAALNENVFQNNETAVSVLKPSLTHRASPQKTYNRVQVTDLFGVLSSSDSESESSKESYSDEDYVPDRKGKGGSSKRVQRPLRRTASQRVNRRKQMRDSLFPTPKDKPESLTFNQGKSRFGFGTRQKQCDETVDITGGGASIDHPSLLSEPMDEQLTVCIPFLNETAAANSLVGSLMKPPLSGNINARDVDLVGTQDLLCQSAEKYIQFCNIAAEKLNQWHFEMLSGPRVSPLSCQIFNECVYLCAAMESKTRFSEELSRYWKTLLSVQWNELDRKNVPITKAMLQYMIDAIARFTQGVMAGVVREGENIQNLLSGTIHLLDEKLTKLMEIKAKYVDYAEELKMEDPSQHEVNMISKTAVLKILSPAYALWSEDCKNNFVIAMINGRSQKWSRIDLITFKSVLKDAAVQAKNSRLSNWKNYMDLKFSNVNGRNSQSASTTAQFRFCIKLPHPSGTVQVIPEFHASAGAVQECYRKEQRKIVSAAALGDEDLRELVDWDNVSQVVSRNLRKPKTPGDCKQAYIHEIHPRAPKKRWTRGDTEKLMTLGREVQADRTTWQAVAQKFENRTDFQCFQQYRTLTFRKKQNRPLWTAAKDKSLLEYFFNEGPNWDGAVEHLQDVCIQRNDVQLRWRKKLNPGLKNGPFSRVEDALLMLQMEKLRGFLCKEEHFGLLMSYLPWRFETVWRDRANCLFADWVVPWTLEEDKRLMELAEATVGAKKWQRIATQFTTFKNRKGCLTRHKILKQKIGDRENQFRTLEDYHIKYSITRYNVFKYKHLAEIESLIQNILQKNLQVPPFPGYPANRPPKEEELQWMLLRFDRSTMSNCVKRLLDYQQQRAELWRTWRDSYGDCKKTFDRRTFHVDNPQSVASALHMQGLSLKQQEDVQGGPLNEFEQLIYFHYARFCSTKAIDRAKKRLYLPSVKELVKMAVIERIVKQLPTTPVYGNKKKQRPKRGLGKKISVSAGQAKQYRKKQSLAVPRTTAKEPNVRRSTRIKRPAIETGSSDTECNVPAKTFTEKRAQKKLKASSCTSFNFCARNLRLENRAICEVEQKMQWKLGKKTSQPPTMMPPTIVEKSLCIQGPNNAVGSSQCKAEFTATKSSNRATIATRECLKRKTVVSNPDSHSYTVEVKYLPISVSSENGRYFPQNSSNQEDTSTFATLSLNMIATSSGKKSTLERKPSKRPRTGHKGKEFITSSPQSKITGKRKNSGSDDEPNCKRSLLTVKRTSYHLRRSAPPQSESAESLPSKSKMERTDLTADLQKVEAGISQTAELDPHWSNEDKEEASVIADTGKRATSPLILRRGLLPQNVQGAIVRTARRSARVAGLPADIPNLFGRYV